MQNNESKKSALQNECVVKFVYTVGIQIQDVSRFQMVAMELLTSLNCFI